MIWWDGAGWSTSLSRAAGLSGEEGEAIRTREAAGERINDLALVDAEVVDACRWLFEEGGFRWSIPDI